MGAIIIFLIWGLSQVTTIFSNLETSMLDVHFKYKTIREKENIQEGVSLEVVNPKISQDIIIVGVDFRSLDKFGKWPFPRWRHADLLKSLSRISNQNARESAVLLDMFFVEPDEEAIDDALLVDAIGEHGRVFLETILDEVPPPATNRDEYYARQEVLYETFGHFRNIQGEWHDVPAFYGLQPPLKPYGAATLGYGHANFFEDQDQVYRRQPLVVRSSLLLEEIPLESLTVDIPLDYENFERIEWVDRRGRHRTLPRPLTEELLQDLAVEMEKEAPQKSEDLDGDGEPDRYYHVLYKYKDNFVPAITLAMALNYFHKGLDDIEVVLGEYIFIPQPEVFDPEIGEWVPYELVMTPAVFDEAGQLVTPAETRVLEDIKIPIDDSGRMLINFMGQGSFATPGGRQTFPIRSYSGYAANPPGELDRWPRTKALDNKIVMVGAFARGIAEDQKTTPYGLMYGIEMHANALNTILMNNFLVPVEPWIDLVLLIGLIMLVAFLTTRVPALWAFLITFVMIVILFFTNTIIFEKEALIVNFTSPAIGMILAFVSIVAYRAMTEERDKRIIKNMFGTYLSPKVVEQILDKPPELGGVDKNLTVFFSDIRGFTTLSESMTPQELVQMLNRYLSAMTDIILDMDGTLDKYEGDAIMAFWGRPCPRRTTPSWPVRPR